MKDTPCDSACGTPDCYKGINSCISGPDCYFASARCNHVGQPECDSCFELMAPCSTGDPCGIGRIRGEWYATSGGVWLPGEAPSDRGRIVMPLPRTTDEVGRDVYTFPYQMIVMSVWNDGGNPFDLEKAKDPATYLKWQVSVWVDPNYATTENDYIYVDTLPYCLQVVDVIPNEGKLAAEVSDDVLCEQLRSRVKCCDNSMTELKELTLTTCQGLTAQGACEAAGCVWWATRSKCEPGFCVGDTNNDAKVYTPDFSAVKWEFGKPGCPACQ